jgi:hypothetical protein
MLLKSVETGTACLVLAMIAVDLDLPLLLAVLDRSWYDRLYKERGCGRARRLNRMANRVECFLSCAGRPAGGGWITLLPTGGRTVESKSTEQEPLML